MKPRLLLLFLFLPLMAGAQTYTYSTLANFPPSAELGPNDPESPLLLDQQGNLYGTSQAGGLDNDGTVFKVTPAGDVITLHGFNGTDGQRPVSGLARDRENNLYGTTVNGGSFTFYGTVYKLAPDGTETVLYSFPGKYPYGNYPIEPVVLDPAKNVYGVSTFSDNNFNTSGGAIFKLTAAGNFTIRYKFCAFEPCPNGDGPSALVLDKAGNLYGATGGGGANLAGNVFELTTARELNILYSFPQGDGLPKGPLVRSGDNFFVASQTAIYRVSVTGGGSVFYTFPSGVHPYRQIVIDSAGNIYGTTDAQTVFKIAPDGTETTIFTGSQSQPVGAAVTPDSLGNLYGPTGQFTGTNQTGTIFKLTKN